MSDIKSRGDVVNEVAAQVDLPQKKVDEVLRAFESAVMRQAASGGEIRMVGFGSFKISYRAARISRNPQSGDPAPVAARNAIRFVPGQALKDAAASSLKDGAAKDDSPKSAAAKEAAPKAKPTKTKAVAADVEDAVAEAKGEKKEKKAKKKKI